MKNLSAYCLSGLISLAIAGCGGKAVVYDPDIDGDKAVVFSSIELSLNRITGTSLDQIDGQSALFTKHPPWKIARSNTDSGQTAWIIAPGQHELTINYTDKAVSAGSKYQASVTVSVKLVAGGQYVPRAAREGDEIQISLVDPRDDKVVAGPIRAPIRSGTVIPFLW